MAVLTLLDWRRRVFALYAAVRDAPDPAAGHEQWRTTRDELLRTHPESPVPAADRARFVGVPVAPYNPDLRFDVEVDTDVEPLRWDVPTGTDGVVAFERVGTVHLPGLGSLDVWWLTSYGGGIFVPVKDGLAGLRGLNAVAGLRGLNAVAGLRGLNAVAGKQTYGGGRYLIDTVKGADLGGDSAGGRLIVDLNFAYNPSCAYDPAWACPLAPPGNVLAEPVYAGELYIGS